ERSRSRTTDLRMAQVQVPTLAAGLYQGYAHPVGQAIAVGRMPDGMTPIAVTGAVGAVLVRSIRLGLGESEAAFPALRVGHLEVRAMLQAADAAPVLDTDLAQPAPDLREIGRAHV